MKNLSNHPPEYPITVRQYVTQKAIPYKETSGELQISCVFGECDYETKHAGHMYIHAETGLYDCKKCGAQGNLWTLSKHLGDNLHDFNRSVSRSAVIKKEKMKSALLDDETVENYHRALPARIRNWLTEIRGISSEVIEARKIGYGTFQGRSWIVIPMMIGEGWFLKLRRDPEDTNNAIKNMVFPAGNEAMLYGREMLAESDYAVIVEGEFDMHVLESQGVVAVTSTGGAGTFKSEWYELFKDVKEIVVCYDNDEQGDKGAIRTLELLASNLPDVQLQRIKLPEEVGPKGDVTDFFVRLGRSLDEFMDLKKPYERIALKAKKPENQSIADELIELVEGNSTELFHDEFKEPMAVLRINGHCETWSCKSRQFKRWLANLYWTATRKVPNGEAIQNALGVIEAKACFEGKTYKLENRIALHDGAFWYDLTNDHWQAVKITENGWEIVNEAPILFKRYAHQQPQVIPLKGGNVRKLLDFFSFSNTHQECLFLVLLVSFFIPGIGHPIPILHGPQGSAKTTRSRMVKRVVDPSGLWVLSLPTDSAQLVQQLAHHHVAFFDNISSLPDWASDILCRAVTGEGTSKRQLYTDDEDVIYVFRRCIGLNGINIAANKADLLDRSILFELQRIQGDKRKTDTELWSSFEAELPSIFGGVLDTLVQAMKIYPTVVLDTLPRMADFARWGSAIAQALGYTSEQFFNAYADNINAQNDEVLEGTPVATAVVVFMAERDGWDGTASELLGELESVAEKEHMDTRNNKWPKAANSLTRRLNEVKPNLLEAGIDIQYIKDTHGKRGRHILLTRNIVGTDETVSASDLDNTDSDAKDCSDDIFSTNSSDFDSL